MESAIMSCWSTEEDLKLVSDRADTMGEDSLSNALIGLSEIHNIRCGKLFEIFEEMLDEGLVEVGHDKMDLESAIMSCWDTREDIDIISENFLDGGERPSSDLFSGLAKLHGMRCKKLFGVFETMIFEGLVR